MTKTYVRIKDVSFSLLLFLLIVPSTFAAEVASRDSIRDIQTILALKGLYDGRIDGLNGPQTERAILLYERNNGRSEIGQPTSQLRETLREEVQVELNRDGSNAADKSQLNELRDKVDALGKALTASDLEQASLSKAVVRIGKDFQTDRSLRERDLEAISIGSTVFKDVITTTLTIIGLALTVGLLATYRRLRATLRSRLLKDHKAIVKEYTATLDTEKTKILLMVCANLSHAFYLYYRDFLDRPGHPAFKSGIALAIWFAENAIRTADALPTKDPRKQELLMYAELHRAHHYASDKQLSSPNAQGALLLTSELYDFTDKLWKKGEKDRWMACRDTLAWILIRLGDRQQQAEGRRIVQALLEHDDVPVSIRKHINAG